MAETEPPGDMTPPFHELRGDYVDGAGQVVTPREFLDYFEPLGSALSRLPDGAGGPFVHQFRLSNRVVGAMGWVVSAASKRFGGWNLWGIWRDGPIPPLALPLFWRELSDRGRSADVLESANRQAATLMQRASSAKILDRLDATPLHDEAFRAALKVYLSRLHRAPRHDDTPTEIDIDPALLDLLPWIYLLGPVDPARALLKPSRFNGAGYQYILTEGATVDGGIDAVIDDLVDTMANDVLQGFTTATALRQERTRPAPSYARPIKHRPVESDEMGSQTTPHRKTRSTSSDSGTTSHAVTAPPVVPVLLPLVLRSARDLIILALLAWIGFNVQQIRSDRGTATAPPTVVTNAPAKEPDALPATQAEVPTQTREQQIGQTLMLKPPQGVRIDPAILNSIVSDASPASTAALSRVSVEIFLRRNGCLPHADAVDGKFSAAEQRAIRSCTALTSQRLMKSATEPNADRAIAWLEKTLATPIVR